VSTGGRSSASSDRVGLDADCKTSQRHGGLMVLRDGSAAPLAILGDGDGRGSMGLLVKQRLRPNNRAHSSTQIVLTVRKS
jgi:hypothetical protein